MSLAAILQNINLMNIVHNEEILYRIRLYNVRVAI